MDIVKYNNFITDCKSKIKRIHKLGANKDADLVLFNWINYGSEGDLFDLMNPDCPDYPDNDNDKEHSPCCTFEEAIRRIKRDILEAEKWRYNTQREELKEMFRKPNNG